METDTYTKTVERLYTEIDGTEVQTAVLLDFLEAVEDTDAMFPLGWSRKYDEAAEALIEAGLVGRTNTGSWYCADQEGITSLLEELRDEYRERMD